MRNKIDLLRYEAKRKPVLAALVERAHELTDNEIASAPLLKWMKEALKTLRRAAQEEMAAARRLMDVMAGLTIVDGVIPDPSGVALRWTGPETFLSFGRSELLVPSGALLFRQDGAGVWFETAYARAVDPRISPGTVEVGPMTKTAYIAMFKAEVASRHATPAATSSNDLGDLGVPGLRVTRLA